jgi:hypothetical protein
MLFSPVYLLKVLKYFVVMMLLIILLFSATKYTTFGLSSLWNYVGVRILYGQVQDLPYYFKAFSDEKVNIRALMPSYVVKNQESAARVVGAYSIKKIYSREKEVRSYLGVVGDANTFFTGEAYAWGGYLGVISSPLIVMANLVFFIYLFSKTKKTWFSVYIFSFLLYKVFIGIFGGISYFIFSSIHIVLMAFLLLLIFWHYLEHKNISVFNKVNENLHIL